LAVALLKAGQRVATIDLDCRQQVSPVTSTTSRLGASHRPRSASSSALLHQAWRDMQIADNESFRVQQFMDAVSAVEETFDFIVIDTPRVDSYLMVWGTRCRPW